MVLCGVLFIEFYCWCDQDIVCGKVWILLVVLFDGQVFVVVDDFDLFNMVLLLFVVCVVIVDLVNVKVMVLMFNVSGVQNVVMVVLWLSLG